uniref:Uncharacterized protein n=1 Tax=Haptolina brevifila TaxID=156173 RepID=A0A7S2NQU8_9EUKA
MPPFSVSSMVSSTHHHQYGQAQGGEGSHPLCSRRTGLPAVGKVAASSTCSNYVACGTRPGSFELSETTSAVPPTSAMAHVPCGSSAVPAHEMVLITTPLISGCHQRFACTATCASAQGSPLSSVAGHRPRSKLNACRSNASTSSYGSNLEISEISEMLEINTIASGPSTHMAQHGVPPSQEIGSPPSQEIGLSTNGAASERYAARLEATMQRLQRDGLTIREVIPSESSDSPPPSERSLS